MYKDHLYLVNGEGNDRETALHDTLVYIVTIYDVITKTARVLCRTYSCPYCIVYICGEWVIYAEPVTFFHQFTKVFSHESFPLYDSLAGTSRNFASVIGFFADFWGPDKEAVFVYF